MTAARDLGAVTIRRVEMTMATVDLFRSECPSDGISRPHGMEDATTDPHHASGEQRGAAPFEINGFEMMQWRDSMGWTDGKRTIYRRGSERSEGKRSVDPVNLG